MLWKISVGVSLLIALSVYSIASRPDEFVISRSVRTSAPPQAVFGQVNDLRQWPLWHPWAGKDPQAKTAFEGPWSGVGATYRWDGDHQVGEGSLTIIESFPDERVRFRLDLVRPFVCAYTVEITLAPEEGTTHVTWSVSGKNDLMKKAAYVAMDWDRTVGDQLSVGLERLRAVAEKRPRPSQGSRERQR